MLGNNGSDINPEEQHTIKVDGACTQACSGKNPHYIEPGQLGNRAE